MKTIQIETLGNRAEVVKDVNVRETSPVNQYGLMMIAVGVRLHNHLALSHEGGIHGQA